MPSSKHQSLARLLTEGRGVLSAVLSFVGLAVPADLVLQPGPDAVRYRMNPDHFADGTMVGVGRDWQGQRAYVIEIQLRKDADKRFTWPMYVAVTRNRLRCATTLVVFTDSVTVERWASIPIEIGEGSTMTPVVIGPRRIPRDLPMAVIREVPVMAVLAVVAHGRGPDAMALGRRAFEVTRPLSACDEPRAILYFDVIFAYLDREVVEQILEDEMQLEYEPISDYFRRYRDEGLAEGRRAGHAEGRRAGHAEGRAEGRRVGRAEGRTEGMARMLERLLVRRGLSLSSEQRSRIRACEDLDRLQRWFDAAVVAGGTDDVFVP